MKKLLLLLVLYCGVASSGWHDFKRFAPFILSNYIVASYCLHDAYIAYQACQGQSSASRVKYGVLGVAGTTSLAFSCLMTVYFMMD
jgi:hypothetical protein